MILYNIMSSHLFANLDLKDLFMCMDELKY